MIRLFIFLFLAYSPLNIKGQAPTLMSIKIVGEKNLALDHETAYPGPLGSTFQYCKDTQRVAYLNRLTSSIKYFDFVSGKALGETQLSIEGPDQVGPDPFYFHYHNRDSIFVLSRGNNFTLNLISGKGKVINSFSYAEDNYEKLPFPESSTIFGGMAIIGSNALIALHVPAFRATLTRVPIIKIDLTSGKKEYLEGALPYQTIALEKVVAPNQYEFYSTRIAANPKTEELIVSYPLDHRLYKFKDYRLKQTVNSKSELIGNFRFLKRDRKYYKAGAREVSEVIHSSAWYFGILYNPFENVYYRIGRVERNIDQVRRQLAGEEVNMLYEYTITALNENLEILAETVVSTKEAIFHRGVFVGPGGLFVAQLNHKGENIMGFSQISLVDETEN